MVLVKHLISPATLPKPPIATPNTVVEQLSILSYNVLLPNSVDGWWTYKMYAPPLPPDLQYQSSWEYRQDLLKQRIKLIDADVVCLQEVSPESFLSDFAFMSDELGYDGVEMYKRGRFRPATFWKKSRCELVTPPVHKDRSLLTAFRPKVSTTNSSIAEEKSETGNNSNWYVVNLHLQAGKQGARRLRQINEALRGVMTMARKQKEPQPEKTVRLVVVGDFNGQAECAAIRYLEDGFVDETFVEDNESVTSKRKELPLASPMMDVATSVVRSPPPTLVVSELISSLMEESTYDNPVLSKGMRERLERIYNRLAANNKDGVMGQEEVEQWLKKINLKLNRGDEFREAAKQMGWIDPNPDDSFEEKKQRVKLPRDGVLTLTGFIQVYQNELNHGKFWGIGHDMAVLGDPLPDAGVFEARFDHMYCSEALEPVVVLDTLSKTPCPNSKEPSDHLPVAAVFQLAKN